MLSGSHILMRSLLEEGVENIFGYPGGAIMPVYDALYDYRKQIKHTLTRHEQGAIHAAQGYARVTGDVGVVFATSGPGATNLMTGIADAMIDSTPLVCFTGQVGSHLLGSDAFQESDIVGMSLPVTKWNIQITSVEEIAPTIAKAFYIAATGRPGPVLIDITKDAQIGMMEFAYEKCTRIRSYLPESPVDTSAIISAVSLINASKKPFVLVGQGVVLSGAEKELLQFIEKTGIPFGSTLLGLSALSSDHPLNMGMLGMHGNYSTNLKTNECDLLIAIGMRFDDRVTGDVKRYASQAKVIHIEIDPAEINKIIKADVAIVADARKALAAINNGVVKKDIDSWVDSFRDLYDIEYNEVIKGAIKPESGAITMGEIIRNISEATDNRAVLVTDVGQQQMMAARYFKFTQTRSCVTSGGLGTMGFGLPASIGAATGVKDRPVISFMGDGGAQMCIQELGTIMAEKLPVKIVILNNNYLGMVRQWQELFYDKRYSFTPMFNPDFIKLAQAYNIESKSISERDDIDQAIEEMLNHDGAYLLEVKVKKQENVFPMVPTGASVSEVLLDLKAK